MSRGKFVYKDQSSRDKMIAFYDRAMEDLNVQYREEYIETSYGNCELVLLGGDHAIYEQRPEECGDIVLEFINGLDVD